MTRRSSGIRACHAGRGLLAAFLLGVAWRERPWRWAALIMAGQAGWSMLIAVSQDGVPIIVLELFARRWEAITDTGFNGYLELPLELKNLLPSRHIGEIRSVLAGG